MLFAKVVGTNVCVCSALRFVVAVVVCLALMPRPSASLPLNDIIGEASAQARREHQLVKRAASMCERPSNLEQMFQALNSQMNLTQFLRPATNSIVLTQPNLSPNSNFELIADPSVSKTCPSSITKDASAPLSDRSSCPFYFDILRLPEGFYPSTLYFAKCKCQECVGTPSMSCEPVKSRITVLRPNGCKQGMQLMQEDTLDVPTSCTCAYKGAVVGTTAANIPPSVE